MSFKHFLPAVALAIASLSATAIASAQEATPGPPPAPAAPATAAPEASTTSAPTFMDQQYDGRTHFMVAPYIWAPTIHAVYQYSVPRLPRPHRGAMPASVISNNIQVGPSQYLPKLNTAAMLAFDVRKGRFDFFGDGIYVNATTTATLFSTITGPAGRVHVPLTINSSAGISTAIWELTAGYTLAHGHDADLILFAGTRQFPINLNVGYTATVGKRGIIMPTGSFTTSDNTSDVIGGLRGRAYFGDGHWNALYYLDYGGGNNNQTWEGYGGAGYTFNHGQTLVALYRALNYSGFPSDSHVQKMNLSGPLLGYTFGI
jgi:hypothetical protein